MKVHGLRQMMLAALDLLLVYVAQRQPLHWLAKPIGFNYLKEIVRQFKKDDLGL